MRFLVFSSMSSQRAVYLPAGAVSGRRKSIQKRSESGVVEAMLGGTVERSMRTMSFSTGTASKCTWHVAGADGQARMTHVRSAVHIHRHFYETLRAQAHIADCNGCPGGSVFERRQSKDKFLLSIGGGDVRRLDGKTDPLVLSADQVDRADHGRDAHRVVQINTGQVGSTSEIRDEASRPRVAATNAEPDQQ